MTKPEIVLIGSGGHSRECIDLIEEIGIYKIAGLIGLEEEVNSSILGYPIIGTDNDLADIVKNLNCALIAVGQIKESDTRIRLFKKVLALGFKLPSHISKTANISRHSSIGAGTVVFRDASIGSNVTIGDNVIINTRALVSHDVIVENHCHISTGAILNGNVHVGQGSFIGSGSIVKEDVIIGEQCIVGMGSVLRHHVKDHGTYVEKKSLLNEINGLLPDFYYSKKYASLYVGAESESTVFEFEYKDKGNIFSTIAIKRKVPGTESIGEEKQYYDLETAYGYGGYYTNSENYSFLKAALRAYDNKCASENIIAEFIRVHPFNFLPNIFHSYLDLLVLDRRTICIDLTLSREDRWKDYTPTTRNILRKASEAMRLEISNDVVQFFDMYNKTMLSNNASSEYSFSLDYFKNLNSLDGVLLFAVTHADVVVGMSFIIHSGKLAHYHLSANSDEGYRVGANYFLLDAICDYFKKHIPDLQSFHLGGGRTSHIDDSLLKFKSKFSTTQKNFYIAGKIHNRKMYDDLIRSYALKHSHSSSNKYFLAYRKQI
jgi:sugar O-acyltransferase (sialic acid O-acetyltransferase NeuD family)